MTARARRGCGCGLGCLPRTAVALALAGVLALTITWVFAPWSFYLGGGFHWIPGWQGSATMHTSAGDYQLRIWMTPTGISRLSGFPTFNGDATLCTPLGERFRLRLYAVILGRSDRDTNGKEVRVELRHRTALWAITANTDTRPHLTLRGRWQNPDLVMNDEGTLSSAFLPDGRVYAGPPRNQPAVRETIAAVFHATPWSWSAPDCPARR